MKPPLRLLIPKKCLSCRAVLYFDEDGFCERCRRGVRTLDGETQVLSETDGLQTVFSYSGAIADILKHFKSKEDKEAAMWFAGKLAQQVNADEIDVVVCVPRAVPGYNQSRALARPLAEKLGKPFVEALLKKKGVKSQTKCRSFEERRENVRYAYRPNRAVSLRGKRVLIVDDIYTSGATLARCSDALRLLGAERVYAVAVAHRSRNRAKNVLFELSQNMTPTVRRFTVSAAEEWLTVQRFAVYRRSIHIEDRLRNEWEEDAE